MKLRNLLIATVISSALLSCNSVTNEEAKVPASEEMAHEAESTEETMAEEAAEVQVITLNQVPGEFTNGDITLEAGTYNFEVQNSGVDHEVGLVLSPKKEDITEDDHIKNAYVSETVNDGDTKACKGKVTLEKGEYVYFCPLNPTPQYTITVE